MTRLLGAIVQRAACVLMAIIIAAMPPIAASAAGTPYCPEHQVDGLAALGATSELEATAGSALSAFATEKCLAADGGGCCPSCGAAQGALGIAPVAVAPSLRGAAAIFDSETADGIATSPGLEPPIG